MPTKTKAELAQELDRKNAELARTNAELEKLKTDVVRVALEAQAEEGWCQSGLEEALGQLGLKAPDRRRLVTVQFTVEYEVDPSDADSDYKGQLEDIQGSLRMASIEVPDNFAGWNGERYGVTNYNYTVRNQIEVLKVEPFED